MKQKEKKQSYCDYDHVELVTRINDLEEEVKLQSNSISSYRQRISTLQRDLENREYVFRILMNHIRDLKGVIKL